MAYNAKSKERTMKYMSENRDKLTLNLPKGDKERYKQYAESRGMSLTSLITELIEKEMERSPKDPKTPCNTPVENDIV